MLEEDEEETHWHHVRLEVVRDRHKHEKCWKKEDQQLIPCSVLLKPYLTIVKNTNENIEENLLKPTKNVR